MPAEGFRFLTVEGPSVGLVLDCITCEDHSVVHSLEQAGLRFVSQRFTPRNVFFLGSLTSLAILLVYAFGVIHLPSAPLRIQVFDLTSPVWSLIAAFLLFYAGRKTRATSPRLGGSLVILACALVLNALGDLTWAILQDVLGLSPFPSLADFFYLAYYPVFLLAILHLPSLRSSRREALLTFQDMAIVLLASILFFWSFILGPVFQASQQEPLVLQLLSLAYPVCDLVLLWAVLLLLFRKPNGESQAPLILVAVAAALFFLTDCLYSYQSVLGTYASGGLLDIGWISAYLMFGLAGALQAASLRQPEQSSTPYLTVQRLNGLVTYLPYIWLLAAFLMLIASHSHPLALDFRWMALGVGAILIIILVRQVMTLQENSALFRQLRGAMDQLQQQAALLGTTNRELQREINERQNAEKQLAYTASHDPLTGLPNRVNLVARLSQVLASGRQHSSACKLLYLDLDKFKEINDSLGHSAGDQVLIGVAGRLQTCLRANDIVARFGGDEFVILLEDSRLMSDAILCANRILDKIHQPFDVLDRKVFISTSIGILPDLQSYTQAEDVIRDADIAMYRAKSLGKARFEIFDPDMRSSVLRRMELENELRHALEREELRLLYQPIYSLKAERLLGFEALLRWRNPLRGLVKPLDFIPLAEETGLILPIGDWVLRQACAHLRQWQQDFPQAAPLVTGVNISPRQMASPGFPEQVRGALEAPAWRARACVSRSPKGCASIATAW